MKKKKVLLAQMNKKISKNGNVYFAGTSEENMRYVLLQKGKKNERGDEKWHLLLSEH